MQYGPGLFIVGLWVQLKSYEDLPPGSHFNHSWDPALEGCPAFKEAKRAKLRQQEGRDQLDQALVCSAAGGLVRQSSVPTADEGQRLWGIPEAGKCSLHDSGQWSTYSNYIALHPHFSGHLTIAKVVRALNQDAALIATRAPHKTPQSGGNGRECVKLYVSGVADDTMVCHGGVDEDPVAVDFEEEKMMVRPSQDDLLGTVYYSPDGFKALGRGGCWKIMKTRGWKDKKPELFVKVRDMLVGLASPGKTLQEYRMNPASAPMRALCAMVPGEQVED